METGLRGVIGASVVKLADSDKRLVSVFVIILVLGTQVVGAQEMRPKRTDVGTDSVRVRSLGQILFVKRMLPIMYSDFDEI